MARISPKVCGMINPAAAPCTARVVISIPADVDSAQTADASTNPATPMRNMRLRP